MIAYGVLTFRKYGRYLVIPIETNKSTTRPEELRPIYTLPSDEKILESIVKEQLSEYLNQHGVIIKQESGFRTKRSYKTALNMVVAFF